MTQDQIIALNNAKNIENLNRDEFLNKPIYQILPLQYLLQICQSKVLRFNNIYDKWEDPYELFFLKQNYTRNGVLVDMLDVARHFYGQCWSMRRESDAMWRIYSPQKDGVKIKTTVAKFIDLLYPLNMQGLVSQFGIVRYDYKTNMIEWMRDKYHDFFNAVSDSLFIKRMEFKHEEEIRFILQEATIDDNRQQTPQRSYVELSIDPYNLIEEIILDPRLTPQMYKMYVAGIRQTIGGNIKISQSSLYSFKPISLTM